MRAREWTAALAAGLVCALLAPGCFAVANLDRFEIEPPACTGNATITRDYHWNVSEIVPHVGELFEMKVVDTSSQRVVAAIVYDPIPDVTPATLEGTLRDALPPGSYVARFWGDHSHDRLFEPSPADHAWIQPVPENGCFSFVHAGPFDADISPIDHPMKGNLSVRLTSVGAFAGKPLIFHASDQSEAQVGYYRLGALPTDVSTAPDLTLFDLAVLDTTYTIDAFVDLDGDGLESAGDPVFAPPPQGATLSTVFELDLGPP